ncbi:MAG TPA: hypothetical protein VFA12_09085 [Stellaceae bacterium]|nr:hypothetical protein [Stellaceae bacterium]
MPGFLRLLKRGGMPETVAPAEHRQELQLRFRSAVALLRRHRTAVAFVAASIAAALVLRRWRYDLHLVAVVLAVAFAWAVVLASQSGGALRNAALAAAALLFVPAAIEVAFALHEPPPAWATYSAPYYIDHPILGFAPRPSAAVEARKTDAAGRLIYGVTYTIDADGLRRTQSNPAGPTFAFFFDSFVFGEGVNDTEALPQVFADLGGRADHVLNFGFHGYGPQAFLRTLETGFRDSLLRPAPLTFVLMTAVWHAERAACRPEYTMATARYTLVAGRALYIGPCLAPGLVWLQRRLNHSFIYRTAARALTDPERDIALYLSELCEGVTLARRKYAARVVILYLRSPARLFAGTRYTDDFLMDRLRQCGGEVMDATPEISPGVPLLDWSGQSRLQLAGDGHPSPAAHRLFALRLHNAVKPRAR